MKPAQAARVLLGLGIVSVLGALSWALKVPLLFASLGPTVFIQLETPRQPAARPWNVVAGHAMGLLAAVAALCVTGARHMPPPVLSGILSWQRELASALAMALLFLIQPALKASHPAAASTTLLVTLGAVSFEPRAMLIIAAGIILTALMGEPSRRFVLRYGDHEERSKELDHP